MKSKFLIGLLLVVLVTLFGGAVVEAQGPKSGGTRAPSTIAGTAFTYQGQVKNNGAPVNGTCDFEFSLWDGPAVGANPIGTTQPKTNVTVTSGLFTIPDLDFGTNAFNGEARYLLIGVRCPAGGGSFAMLTPRQLLTPAPMALALPGLYTQPNTTSPNVIGGYSGNTVDNGISGSVIGGGGQSGNINHVTASYATIGGGEYNSVNGFGSTICGGLGNTANVDDTTVGGGTQNIAGGIYSTIGGGQLNTTSALYATVPGGFYASATHYGEMAYASGKLANAGDAQASVYVLRNTTTNNIQTELFLDGAWAAQRITLASNRTLSFDILISARASNGASAGYRIAGVIKNVSGTTSFIGSAPATTVLAEEVAGWDAVVQAEMAHNALVVKVTGANSTNIHWVATVHTAEAAY